MTKKQYILASFLAALPAWGLVAAMLWALLGAGFLEDAARRSAALWVVFGLTMFGGLVVSIFPFAAMIFPGLVPIGAMAGAPSGTAAPLPKSSGKSKPAAEEEEEEVDEELSESEEYSEDSSEEADSGEQMFDDDAMDDFDDFEEEDDSSKKKKKR